jgi:hypothetical protein
MRQYAVGELSMTYDHFTATNRADQSVYECRFRNIMTGIAPRHADTVDIRFLVNGKTYAVALAHPAFVLFEQRTGRRLTDSDSIQMAGLFLKTLLERGEQLNETYLAASVDQTLELAQKVRSVAFA